MSYKLFKALKNTFQLWRLCDQQLRRKWKLPFLFLFLLRNQTFIFLEIICSHWILMLMVSFCHNAINKKHILQHKSCPLLIEMHFPPDKIQLFNSVSFNVHIPPSFAVQLHVQALLILTWYNNVSKSCYGYQFELGARLNTHTFLFNHIWQCTVIAAN